MENGKIIKCRDAIYRVSFLGQVQMKIIFFETTLVLFFCLFLNSKAQEAGNILMMKEILQKEIQKHPEMEIQDIYKFIHQAAMGSEHAVKDTTAVREWMKNEIAGLKFDRSENLIDTISPGGKIVRINLRPYLKAGYDTEKLLNAFIKTANEFKGSTIILEKYIQVVFELVKDGRINFPEGEVRKFFNDLKIKNYPAVHHSKKYEEKYSPAYRVISGELIPL
jgi:hypothetical protein